MAFAITAEFPLGTYRARRPDGSRDDFPSPARLHAAFLAAAGQGVRAVARGPHLEPCTADRMVLHWLEGHPPDAIACPPLNHEARQVIAHRAEGFFGVRQQQAGDERTSKSVLVTREDQSVGVAVGGPIAWIWDDPPPDEIARAMAELCPEVAYLGTVESPVRLMIGDAQPTHRRDPASGLLGAPGLDLDVPRPGRTDALEAAFGARRALTPRPSDDAHRKQESALSEQPERASTGLVRYVPLARPASAAPWPVVVVLPVDRVIAPDRRLAWCVALHRALIARIGDGAPALVTGHYDPGVRPPANRLAIQYLPQDAPGAPFLGGNGAFLLLVPSGADPEELDQLDRAARSLREIRRGAGRSMQVGEMRAVDGADFWQPVPNGMTRLWVTATPAIPESRPLRGRPWTLGDAALLSVGLVFRDHISMAAEPTASSRSGRHAAMVQAVAGHGARVLEAHKLNDAGVHRFVHRTNGQTAVQPYRAALSLGELAGDRTLLAIGQSRHLGGGLLVPVDLAPMTAGAQPVAAS